MKLSCNSLCEFYQGLGFSAVYEAPVRTVILIALPHGSLPAMHSNEVEIVTGLQEEYRSDDRPLLFRKPYHGTIRSSISRCTTFLELTWDFQMKTWLSPPCGTLCPVTTSRQCLRRNDLIRQCNNTMEGDPTFPERKILQFLEELLGIRL